MHATKPTAALFIEKHTWPHLVRQGWVMGIISISQPDLGKLKEFAASHRVRNRAGLLLQSLDSYSRAPSSTPGAINLM
jgi:hypothetical protein